MQNALAHRGAPERCCVFGLGLLIAAEETRYALELLKSLVLELLEVLKRFAGVRECFASYALELAYSLGGFLFELVESLARVRGDILYSFLYVFELFAQEIL